MTISLTRVASVVIGCGGFLLGAARADAQNLDLARPSVDSSALDLRRELRRAVERTRDLELQSAQALQGAHIDSLKRAEPLFRRHRDALASLEKLLDSVVFSTPWGPEELENLRATYPGSRLLDRFAAQLASRRGDNVQAVQLYQRLLQRHAADVVAQRGYASALAAAGRDDEARTALVRALDMMPEEDAIFRELLRMDRDNGSVTNLLDQVRRLQVRRQRSRKLVEWEVELLQRLGRQSEAMVVAKRLEEKKP